MKTAGFGSRWAAFGAAMALAASVGTASAAEIFYNTPLPPNEPLVSAGLVPYFERVSKETNGALSARVMTAGQMFSPLETLNAIKDGALGGGYVLTTLAPNALPTALLIEETVGINENPRAAIGAALETYLLGCDSCKAEADAQNIVMLAGPGAAPFRLMCTREISDFAQLSGLRIRAISSYMTEVVKSVGGVPVNVSSTEIMPSLDSGALDCLFAPKSWLVSLGLGDVIKSVIDSNYGSVTLFGLLTFRKDLWDNLAPDVRAVAIRNAPIMVSDIMAELEAADERAVERFSAAGLSMPDLGQPFLDAASKLRENEPARIVASAGARNVQGSEELLASYRSNYEKWLAISEDAGSDKGKFADALWEHIYSKLPQ